MTQIKDLVKSKKRSIIVEEEAKPATAVRPAVLTVRLPAEIPPAQAAKKAKLPVSPLQALGNKRNWDILQVKGSIASLEKLRNELAGYGPFEYVYQNGLRVIQDELLRIIDKKWESDKRAYLQKVEEEAFAVYPRSFRGSPAEINKRLDILQAQREF